MCGSSRKSRVRWSFEACVALLALIAAAGCQPKEPPIDEPPVEVAPSVTKSATIGADFKVEPGTINLLWSTGETVAWHNESTSSIVIRFHNSDHEIAEVVAPNSWSSVHRAVAKGIHGYKIYKIEADNSLKDTSSDPPAEPKIDVGP